jgi:hypothetical protein
MLLLFDPTDGEEGWSPSNNHASPLLNRIGEEIRKIKINYTQIITQIKNLTEMYDDGNHGKWKQMNVTKGTA